MKPGCVGIEEMTEDNIITVDIEGDKVSGDWPRHNEVYIHSEVMRAKPEINCVIHTHPEYAIAFSSLGKQLSAMSNDGTMFSAGVPIFSETTDLITDQPRGKAVAKCMGSGNVVILRNHGIVAAGRSIEEAVWLAVKLEKACRVQLLAEAAGGPKLLAEGADLEKKNQRGTRPDNSTNVFNYLVRAWCRAHGTPGDPCCGEHYATDTSGYER